MKEIRSDEARRTFRDLLDDVEHHGEHVTILRYTTPAAVIVPVQWYERAAAMTKESAMTTATVTVTTPEAGRIYRYTGRSNSGELIFVTRVDVWPACWQVQGYRVTRSYVLTDEAVTESGQIGDPYGVHYEAFCRPIGVPLGSEGQRPLFSASFPASDASLVSGAEAQGRKRHLA